MFANGRSEPSSPTERPAVWSAVHEPDAVIQFLRANPEFTFHLLDFIESTRFLDGARGRFFEFLGSFKDRPIGEGLWQVERERMRRAASDLAAYREVDWAAPEYWEGLRLIDKDDLRSQPGNFRRPETQGEPTWRRPTSGTTGPPIEACWSAEFYFEINLLQAVEVAWLAGVPLEDLLARPVLSLTLHDKKDHTSCVWTAPDGAQGLLARLVFDERSPSSVQRALDLIETHRPGVLILKPNILDFVVRHQPERLRRCGASLLMVISAGADLEPDIRKAAEAVIEAPIVDVYGLTELGTIGSQCEALAGLHVWQHDTILEIRSSDGTLQPSGEGELVVTRFANSAMPLLRYRTGDLVKLGSGPCACGRPGLILETLCGRLARNFRMPDGSELSPTDFDVLIRTFPLREFRMTQDSSDHLSVEVEIEPTEPDLTAVLHDIREAVLAQLRGKLRVTIRGVDGFEGGKFQRYRTLL